MKCPVTNKSCGGPHRLDDQCDECVQVMYKKRHADLTDDKIDLLVDFEYKNGKLAAYQDIIMRTEDLHILRKMDIQTLLKSRFQLLKEED